MPVVIRQGPLPDGHPLKGVSITFGPKQSESSPKASPGSGPAVPVRGDYQTQDEWEEVVGFYRSRSGRIQAMVASQDKREAAMQTEASKDVSATSDQEKPTK